jgi:cell division control protein 45
MGAIIDLPSSEWFGEFNLKTTIHVIDSTRPLNLSSLFGAGQNGERIVIWDDGDAENLKEERKAWEALMYEPEADSDDDDSEDEDDEEQLRDEEDDYEDSSQSGKRRSLGDGERSSAKRQRLDDVRSYSMTPLLHADDVEEAHSNVS